VSTTLLFVRHAEVHNPRDVVYGRLPRFGLSAKGREQAQRVADYLAADPIAAIYTSPLLRARQTAAAIAAHHPDVPMRRTSLIMEIRTGWQGTPNKDFPPNTSLYVNKKHTDDETDQDLIVRMRRAVRILLRRHPGQTVVCVSHADPIAALTLWACGLDVTPQLLQKPLAPGHATVTIFEYPSSTALPILGYVNPHPPTPHHHKADKPADKAAEQATAAVEATQEPTADPAPEPTTAPASAPPASTGAVPTSPSSNGAGTATPPSADDTDALPLPSNPTPTPAT
jgi:broad specificity phosphatase PhoE